jgi:hypothetical protein
MVSFFRIEMALVDDSFIYTHNRDVCTHTCTHKGHTSLAYNVLMAILMLIFECSGK